MRRAWEAILADASATSIVDYTFAMVLEFVVIINYSSFVCYVCRVLTEGNESGIGDSRGGQGSGECGVR